MLLALHVVIGLYPRFQLLCVGIENFGVFGLVYSVVLF